MRIIGLCGAAGAGKGTVAEALVERCSLVEMAFADRIYTAVANITGYSVLELKDREFKEKPIEWLGGKSPRHLLQTLGTEWGRDTVSASLWVDATMRHIEHLAGCVTTGIVLTDVRFDNEAEAIRRRGGVVWEVRRPVATCLDETAAAHESERGISHRLVDLVLTNESTPQALADAAEAAYHRQYRAAAAVGGV